MDRLTLEARLDNLDEVLSFIDERLEKAGCPVKTQMQLDVAVEEIYVNIAHYAYSKKDESGKAIPDTGTGMAAIEISHEEGIVTVTFTDQGMPFDPLAKEDPDVTLSAEERQIGGLGIFMVKKSMDDMKYQWLDGKNVLTLTKLL